MLRTLIVDDEAPARARLRRLLAPLADAGRVAIAGEAADGVEALERLAEEKVDLVLLDVQMPGLSGFDVLDRLGPDRPPAVVFVTAYDRYAVQAFEAAAVDYLLKPVTEERLTAALERAERSLALQRRDEAQDRLAALLEYLDRNGTAPRPHTGSYLKYLTIPGTERIAVVPVERLVAAEVEESMTRLYLLGQDAPNRLSRHTIPHPLDALERRLDPEAFLRVHRSAIVQVACIREMVPWFSGRCKLVLAGGHEVIASRARAKELRERMSL